MTAKEFKESFAIQFSGAQQRRKYALSVGAKLRSNIFRKPEIRFTQFPSLDNEIRRSNVIAVSVPMDVPYEGAAPDRYFPYIVVNEESVPADSHLEGRLTMNILFLSD